MSRLLLPLADHYTGLRDTWDYGLIYCSEDTGRLIQRIAGVKAELVRAIPWDTPTIVDGEQELSFRTLMELREPAMSFLADMSIHSP